MTPHTLRRTFASILAAANVSQRHAMYLLGHTDAKLTPSVYQQVLDMESRSVEVLEGILGCSLQEACDVMTGRVLVGNPLPALLPLLRYRTAADSQPRLAQTSIVAAVRFIV